MRRFLCIFLVVLCSTFLAVGQRRIDRSEQVVMLQSQPYYVHTAKRWQEVSDIARAYGVSVADIYASNPSLGGKLRGGETVLIPVPAAGLTTPVQDPAVDPSEGYGIMPSGGEMTALDGSNTQFIGTTQQPSNQYGLGSQRTGVEGLDSLVGAYSADPNGAMHYPMVQFGKTKPINPNLPLEVAVLLPFEGSDPRSSARFVGFLNGMLLSLDNLPRDHRGVNIRVISTNRTPERINQIIVDGTLDGVDLIVGPVYAEEFEVAALYSSIYRVPIISPLGSAGAANHPYVIEVAPHETTIWDKFHDLFNNPSQNVILVNHMTLGDTVELARLHSLLPLGTKILNYQDKNTDVDSLSKLLVRGTGRENLLVVPVGNEPAVEEILARFNSINTNRRYKITTVGMPSWARFGRLDMDLFFRMGVRIPTTYYFDRLSEPMSSFYNSYISKHGVLPSLYAMRGYDVGVLFCGMLLAYGEDLLYELIRDTPTPLQTPYLFDQSSDTGRLHNIDWPIVEYHPNYTITIR